MQLFLWATVLIRQKLQNSGFGLQEFWRNISKKVLCLMMSGWNRAKRYSVKIVSANFWNGKISRTQADVKAFSEYDIFNRTQKIDSDFDKMIRKKDWKIWWSIQWTSPAANYPPFPWFGNDTSFRDFWWADFSRLSASACGSTFSCCRSSSFLTSSKALHFFF